MPKILEFEDEEDYNRARDLLKGDLEGLGIPFKEKQL